MDTTMDNLTPEARNKLIAEINAEQRARNVRKRMRKAPIIYSTLDKRKRPTRPERRAAWHAMGGNRPTWMDYNV